MIEDDMGVYFAPGEFAVPCTRERLGAADAHFAGIVSHADEDALDMHAIGAVHRLSYATAAVDLEAGDLVWAEGVCWRVRRVDRVNDGSESVALLRSPREAA